MTYPMEAPPAPKPKTNIWLHVITLLLLLVVLSFVLVHFNVVSCGAYTSFGCDLYYSLPFVAGGKPRVLIVHGEEGTGNPDYLLDVLRSSRFSAVASTRDLEVVSLPILREYQLVIVERAREMSIDEIKMFMEYSNLGGKLVWIGDAGTTAPENESDLNYFLTFAQREEGASNDYIGPWARRSGNKQVSLDIFLGVDYQANYCELSPCSAAEYTGNFDFVQQEHRLVYGLGQNLPFYGDFAMVKSNSGAFQTNLAFLDFGSDLIATPSEGQFWLKGERTNFGNEFPIIVVSGVGGRVAYYAFPPEFFVSDAMPLDEKTGERIQYWALMENMYYGMLYK